MIVPADCWGAARSTKPDGDSTNRVSVWLRAASCSRLVPLCGLCILPTVPRSVAPKEQGTDPATPGDQRKRGLSDLFGSQRGRKSLAEDS